MPGSQVSRSSMSNTILPLRIKVDIGDQFDSSNSAAQKALSTLEDIVGLKTSCIIDWELLWDSFEASHPDRATFVSSIVDLVVAWCDVLSTRLEDDKFAAWAETIFEKLEAAGQVRLIVQISDSDRPSTTWSDSDHAFLLLLPHDTDTGAIGITSGFESDLQHLFSNMSTSGSSDPLPGTIKEDRWADVGDTGEAMSLSTHLARLSLKNEVDTMPSVTSIASPDVLFRNLTPYILLVQQRGPNKLAEFGSARAANENLDHSTKQSSSMQIEHGGRTLVVQGTHAPSVQFLHQYLQRWVRRNHQDVQKVPLLRLRLLESNFGPGLSYDTLVIEPYDEPLQKRGVEMNPTIVWSLVENVLGYESLRGSNGYWEFRRNTPFK